MEDYSLDPTRERYSLSQVSDWVMQSLTEPADLTRITYEAFDIHDVPPRMLALGYAGAVAVYVEGIQRAERDFGIRHERTAGGRHRPQQGRGLRGGLGAADPGRPSPYVVGIGLDNLETAGPPELFAEAYQLATLSNAAGSGRSECSPKAGHVVEGRTGVAAWRCPAVPTNWRPSPAYPVLRHAIACRGGASEARTPSAPR